MAEDQEQEAEDTEEDLPEGEELEAPKKGMNKMILFVGAPVILIVVGLAAAYFLGFFGGVTSGCGLDLRGGVLGGSGDLWNSFLGGGVLGGRGNKPTLPLLLAPLLLPLLSPLPLSTTNDLLA